jgi:hypothetical protein
MKKISLLLCAPLLGAVSPFLLAQNSTGANNPGATSNQVESSIELINFFSDATETDMLRNGIKNSDGTFTIKAGRQTPEAHALDLKICANFGAKDVTNEINITLGPGTRHAGACVRPLSDRRLGSSQTVSEFRNQISEPNHSKDIEIVPCFVTSTISASGAPQNYAGYSSCTSPLIKTTYKACFGENCSIHPIEGQN